MVRTITVISSPSAAVCKRSEPLPIINTEEAVTASSSRSSSSFKNVMSGVATLASSFTRASRARSRCSFIAASKPSWSIVKPRSEAISSVNSQGNPYVSYNLNTSVPGTTVAFSAASVSIKEFNNSRPCSNVWLNRSSSFCTTRLTKSCFSAMDLIPGPRISTTTSISGVKKIPSIPSKRP